MEKAAQRLRNRVVEDSGSDMNVDIFDASEEAAQTVLLAASTLPFGEGVRLVMVKNAGAWHKADKDTIVNFLADPPQQTCLALIGRGIRKNEGLWKAVAEAGQVLSYDSPRASHLPAWAKEQAGRLGLKLGSKEAGRLVMIAGTDQRSILGELDKLAAYKGKGEVSLEDIDKVCWVTAEVKVWDLTDALGAKDREATFRHLEELLADRTAPASVFYTVTTHLKRLCSITEAMERGEDPNQTAKKIGLKPYPAKKIIAQSRNFNSNGLKKALMVFSEADADMKGRKDQRPDLVLEAAISRVLDISKE